MTTTTVLYVDGLDELIAEVDTAAEKTQLNIVRALNKGAERGRAQAKRQILQEVAFPTGYLDPSQRRLTTVRTATTSSLEAIVRGRDRPTSLARFARNRPSRGQDVLVEVKVGRTKALKRAFLVNLRNGNQGLAIRLPAGETPGKAYKPTRLANGVWLLYGPSVNQAFAMVADDLTTPLAKFVADEFLRLSDEVFR